MVYDVHEGLISLEGTTYAVLYGITRVQFYLAPPGSLFWTLNTG
ncbi:hypothetical protein [Sorangium sp. So ce1078]